MNTANSAIVSEMMRRYRLGRMSRRDVIRSMGALGLATAGIAALGGRRAFARQDAPATPAATPVVGPQADGSTLWRVKVGDMKMDAPIELHAFFPGEITIAVGDSIWFDFGQMPMFHTVSFPAGGEAPGLLIPDPEVATPEAGAPPKLILNPAVLFPAGGPEFDGSAYLNSGADFLLDPATPFVVKFTAEGSFDYLCVPHGSVMQAKVNVVAAGTALPMDQAGYDAQAAEQIAALYEQGQAELETYSQATSTANADGTTTWEATAGAGGATPVRIQAILPLELEIHAGDTVKWVNRSPGEPHTVSFVGSDTTPPEDSIVEQFADGSPKFVQNMQTFLPQGGPVFSGTGFANSGFMGIPELGLPMEYSLTFDTPGDYIAYCILHGNAAGERMAAKLKVLPKA